MKRFIFIILFFTGIGMSANAQTAKDIFTAKQIVWFGLDYSQVKLLGSIGFNDVQRVKDFYFDAWNQVILTESKKYDLRYFLRKPDVVNDLSVVKEKNKLPEESNLLTDDPAKKTILTPEKIQSIISSYSPIEKEGIGVVFLIGNLDRINEVTNIYVTFFNIGSKKVLLTEELTGKAGGVGFRNYWLGSIYNVMKEMKSRYSKWQEQYYK
jgi:hypothetical protein